LALVVLVVSLLEQMLPMVEILRLAPLPLMVVVVELLPQAVHLLGLLVALVVVDQALVLVAAPVVRGILQANRLLVVTALLRLHTKDLMVVMVL
jgi:hypothetical protein